MTSIINAVSLAIMTFTSVFARSETSIQFKSLDLQTVFQSSESYIEVKYVYSMSDESNSVMLADYRPSVTVSEPMMLVKAKGEWSAYRLEKHSENDNLLGQQGWVSVVRHQPTRHLLAVLDCQVESPGWELLFLLSRDDGKSWSYLGQIKKPHYFCSFNEIQMQLDGTGKLRIQCPGDGLETEGFYTAQTSDFGRSWSPPTLDPNSYFQPLWQPGERVVIRNLAQLGQFP